jgi:hypothetical protein
MNSTIGFGFGQVCNQKVLDPKVYKVVVLNATPNIMKRHIFNKQVMVVNIETLAELDGRPLRFSNNTRPRSRYVWWTYLAAITYLA